MCSASGPTPAINDEARVLKAVPHRGAADTEVRARMPGAAHVPHAPFAATRAISIAASPPEVWPWLVQVGVGRAGFYSYDLLDNRGTPSAGRIIPGLQEPRVGDWIPMSASPSPRTAFCVAAVAPERSLLWLKPGSSW